VLCVTQTELGGELLLQASAHALWIAASAAQPLWPRTRLFSELRTLSLALACRARGPSFAAAVPAAVWKDVFIARARGIKSPPPCAALSPAATRCGHAAACMGALCCADPGPGLGWALFLRVHKSAVPTL